MHTSPYSSQESVPFLVSCFGELCFLGQAEAVLSLMGFTFLEGLGHLFPDSWPVTTPSAAARNNGSPVSWVRQLSHSFVLQVNPQPVFRHGYLDKPLSIFRLPCGHIFTVNFFHPLLGQRGLLLEWQQQYLSHVDDKYQLQCLHCGLNALKM